MSNLLERWHAFGQSPKGKPQTWDHLDVKQNFGRAATISANCLPHGTGSGQCSRVVHWQEVAGCLAEVCTTQVVEIQPTSLLNCEISLGLATIVWRTVPGLHMSSSTKGRSSWEEIDSQTLFFKKEHPFPCSLRKRMHTTSHSPPPQGSNRQSFIKDQGHSQEKYKHQNF